jgi:hypothetical protein
VRTLVAHEPPLLELLDDADDRRAEVDDIVATFHRDGQAAAFATFMASAGFDPDDGPPPGEPSPQMVADGARFLGHELRGTTRYVPDLAVLATSPTRVVIGLGADSGGLSTFRTSHALAERLGLTPVGFPGGHGGFMDAPQAFADVLRQVLGDG